VGPPVGEVGLVGDVVEGVFFKSFLVGGVWLWREVSLGGYVVCHFIAMNT